MRLKVLSLIAILLISIISYGTETEMTEYIFSGQIIDYDTGEGIGGIKVELNDVSRNEILFCETNDSGEWCFEISIDNNIQKRHFVITPRPGYGDEKFSPGQVFISNDAGEREKVSLKAYGIEEARDSIIEKYRGEYTGITYLGNNKWRFIFDVSDYDARIHRNEVESVRFGHELGSMDINHYFTRQENGIWVNEVDLSGLNPDSHPEKEKNYYPELFEFNIVVKLKGEEQERKTSIFVVGETHLLEMEAEKYVDNSRDYEWYYPQDQSEDPDHNCGPAVIVMAARWYDNNFSKTIDEVREEIGIPVGTGISISNTIDYLNKYQINYNEIYYPTIDEMVKILDQGSIIISFLNPTYIRINYGRNNFNINRQFVDYAFYDIGHAIIIKGYKKYTVKDKEFLLFEVYDPVLGYKDSTNRYIGKDIHYFAEDVFQGMKELAAPIIIEICDEKREIEKLKLYYF